MFPSRGVFFLLILCFHVSAYAQSSRQKEVGKLVIGSILPLSGPQADYGKEALAGIKLALDHLKKTDPKLAALISVMSSDDQSRPSQATKIANDLITKNRVSVLFGSVTASSTIGIAKTAQKYRKPLVSPASDLGNLTSIGSFVFSSCVSAGFHGQALAHFTVRYLEKKSVAIMTDNSAYSKAVTDAFSQSFKALGGMVIHQEEVDRKATKFKVQLKKISSFRPQAILFPSFYQQSALAIKQAKQMGINIPFLGTDAWNHPSFVAVAGKSASEGHYFSTHFSAVPNSQFVNDFIERFKLENRRVPSALAAMTFDGILMIADAFKNARSNRSTPLAKALGTIRNSQGLLGKYNMSKSRYPIKPLVILKTGAQGAQFNTLLNVSDQKS